MKKTIILLLAAIALYVTACSNQNIGIIPVTKDKPIESKEFVGLDGKIGGEISISCYDTMSYKSYLEAAAKDFEEKYPDVKVNIIPFSVLPETNSTVFENGSYTTVVVDQAAINDYIKRTNTELISGRGSDILAMDVLPYYKYAESGHIENLTLYMEADANFEKEKYRQNIFNALRYKGGLFIFPMDFSFEYVSFDKTLFDEEALKRLSEDEKFSFDELTTIGRKSFDSAKTNIPIKMFNAYADGDIFVELFKQDYNKFINIAERKANFMDGKFINLLETVKLYSDNGYLIPTHSTGRPDRKESIFKTTLFAQDNTEYLFKNKYSSMLSMSEEDETIKMMTNEVGEVPFEFGQGYAINSNSQNKKTAWEFIKFMASEEIQKSNSFFNLEQPINIKAFEDAAKTEKMADNITYDGNTLDINYSTDEKRIELFQTYLAELNQYSDMLNTYLIEDNTVNEIVYRETNNYFNGTKTALEVAEAAQRSIELYLNE